MAQIRSKQIADFLATVNWATVTENKIAGAVATKAYIDSVTGQITGNINASIDSLEVALSTEINSTNSDVTRIDGSISAEITRATSSELSITNRLTTEINRATSVESNLSANINTEKSRIDAILTASDADKDSFVEIVSLINAVDTTNDGALAVVVGNLNAEIAATNSDVTSINTRANALAASLSSEIVSTNNDVTSIDTRATALAASLSSEIVSTNNDVTSIDARATALAAALSSEIVATNSDVTSINTRATLLTSALSSEISSTNSDFVRVEAVVSVQDSIEKARAIAAETSITTKVTSIESALMQDFEMFEETFTGTISLTYSLINPVQDNNKYLAQAYVNGIKTSIASVSGTSVVIANPGYAIDANDVVVITYQF